MVNRDVALELKMINTIEFVTNLLIFIIFSAGFLLCLIAFVIKIVNNSQNRKKMGSRENSEKNAFIENPQVH